MMEKHGYKSQQDERENGSIIECSDIQRPGNIDSHVPDSNDVHKTCDQIEKNIEIIISRHGIDGEEWAKAISSQYFLLSYAKLKNHDANDYETLLNNCVYDLRANIHGEPNIDETRLLITPEETTKIVEAMKTEDRKDKYYANKSKMKAENIDAAQMYANFHYGLAVKIVSFEATEILNSIRRGCLKYLFSDNAIDHSGGWYPYRVPWITGRILISLATSNIPVEEKPEKYDQIVENAVESIYRRIGKDHYWRSGVGDWVSKWESTSLCLEALYEQNAIRGDEIKPVIDYCCCEDSIKQWIRKDVKFDTEEDGNHLLAFIMLSSTLLRVTKKKFPEQYNRIAPEVLDFFDYVIDLIMNQSESEQKAGQYCTVPEILYYVQLGIDCLRE